MTKYTVVGPMSKGNELAHVHIKGCRDLNNLRIYRGQHKTTVEAESPMRAAFAAVLDRDLGYTEADAKVFPCCGKAPEAETGTPAPGVSTGKKSRRAKAKAEPKPHPNALVEIYRKEKRERKAAEKAQKAPAPAKAEKVQKAPAGKRLELTTRQRDLLQTHAINTPTKDEIGAKGKMVTVTAEFVKDLVWLAQDKDPVTARVFKGLLDRTNAWVVVNGLSTL